MTSEKRREMASVLPTVLMVPVLLLLPVADRPVDAHGMLWWPVNRGSMWRLGYDTPVNYDDNAQFCGGSSVQWQRNHGECGECGDDYALPRPRPSENTGKYGTGIVVATFTRGQKLNATVRLTANHRGHFAFKLCPLDDVGGPKQLETQACFDQHPVAVIGAGDHEYRVPSADPGDFGVPLQLPADVSCKRCVLQWTYTAGNSWGTCRNGTSGLGCGPQETFRTCSDIAID